MNQTLQRIEGLRKAKQLSVNKMCKEIGIAQSTYATWLKAQTAIRADKIDKFAEFFGVSTDYLINGQKSESTGKTLNEKDERDIKQAIEDFKNRLSTAGVMYDGEPLDEESQAAILAAVELAERTARIAAKEKFTPKKYKK